ncbi:MAG: type II toxin-antitoxin system RelE/ParE family toxin [Tannerella sp.]|jgi:plasmid stabilization system protein ParE|nr:type II toxin-antitoxin system RelE/ParE family toxin [Tannerella sp.]
MNFTIIFSPLSKRDIANTFHYITHELKEPSTANKYVEGIYQSIKKLAANGNIYAPSEREYIQNLYGPNARTVRYKKMTIVFNIIGNIILIRRVMASSLVR